MVIKNFQNDTQTHKSLNKNFENFIQNFFNSIKNCLKYLNK